MFSRKLTRSIAIGATAVAIGGGTYGIVSATANTGSGGATTASPPGAIAAQRVRNSGSTPAGWCEAKAAETSMSCASMGMRTRDAIGNAPVL